VTTTKATGST